jgi:hypothetical protein
MNVYIRSAVSATRKIMGYVDEAGVVRSGTGDPLPGKLLGHVAETGETYQRQGPEGDEFYIGYVTEDGDICKDTPAYDGGYQVGLVQGKFVQRGTLDTPGPRVAYAEGEAPARVIGGAALILGMLDDVERCPSCKKEGFIVQKGVKWLCKSCGASGTLLGRR